MVQNNLNQLPAVDLTGSASTAEMAARESWNPDKYAVVLAENIRESAVPLDTQRERLAALAQAGAVLQGDGAAAQELARHALILNALFERFARVAADLSAGGGNSVASERYLNAALKAQRAAMATLSALKVLRDSATAPTTPTPGTLTAPAPRGTAGAGLPLPGAN